MINEKLQLEVFENWDCRHLPSEWTHSSGNWTCKRDWSKVKFTDNGTWYKIVNLGFRRYGNKKVMSATQHRIVYSTFNNLDYYWEYTVWHYDDNPWNNALENLYGIFGSKQGKQNLEHKKNAYKLLERYKQGKYTIPKELAKQLV